MILLLKLLSSMDIDNVLLEKLVELVVSTELKLLFSLKVCLFSYFLINPSEINPDIKVMMSNHTFLEKNKLQPLSFYSSKKEF
jgi:hypothetical protein